MQKSDYKLLNELVQTLPFENIAYQETTLKGYPTNRGRIITLRATQTHPDFGKATMLIKIEKHMMREIDNAVLFNLVKQSFEDSYNDGITRRKQGVTP